MALSFAKVTGRDGRSLDGVWGDGRRHVRDVTITSTPSSGGDAITAAQVGLTSIDDVVIHGAFRSASGTTAVVANWNASTSKLQVYETAAAVDLPLDEADGTPSLANFVGRVSFFGPRAS